MCSKPEAARITGQHSLILSRVFDKLAAQENNTQRKPRGRTDRERTRFIAKEISGEFGAGGNGCVLGRFQSRRDRLRAVRSKRCDAVVRSADTLGAAHAGRKRSRPIRRAVLAGLLQTPSRRCCLPHRRRRGLLLDEGPATLPQCLVVQSRRLCRTPDRLPPDEHGRHRTH